MIKNYIRKNKTSIIFAAGLLLFFGINLFSAITMGIHFDEAYYWLYSQHLALGYFDHPPMIAWLIYIGQSIFNNTLGLRVMIILLSSCSVSILWLLSKKYGEKPLLFWALIYSIILIQPYAFIATPDAPLFFFASLFFFMYDRYLKKQNAENIILLALVTGLMFYSKYHGLLIVMFSVFSNLNELKKKSFWIFTLLVALLMIPHLIWQIENNFISFRYHLIDSHKTAYNPMVTVNYLLNQLLLFGPWMGWLLLLVLFKKSKGNYLEKALRWTGIGTIVFFFIATFSGDFEAHWTLIATIPMIVLSFKFINEKKQWQRWILISGGINFVILLSIRILIITPIGEKIHAFGFFNGWDKNSVQLKYEIGDFPILFQDTWNKAARFAWYSNDPNISNLNSALHRRNQFDIWDIDEKLTGKTVCIVTTDSTQFIEARKLKTSKINWYFKIIENFKSYYNLELAIENQKVEDDSLLISVTIKNPYNILVELGEGFTNAFFQLYGKDGNKWILLKEKPIEHVIIQANSEIQYQINFKQTEELSQETYLMLKIGELNPIPSKCKIH